MLQHTLPKSSYGWLISPLQLHLNVGLPTAFGNSIFIDKKILSYFSIFFMNLATLRPANKVENGQRV